MNKVNSLIGRIDVTEPKSVYVKNGERFYTVTCQFLDTLVDLVVSEYIYTPGMVGVVKVTGDVVSRWYKEERAQLYTYINAYNIEFMPDDTPLTNEVDLYVKVSNVVNFHVTKQGVEILTLTCSCETTRSTVTTLHMYAKLNLARKLKNVAKGDILHIKGYLRENMRKQSIEILIHEVLDDTVED